MSKVLVAVIGLRVLSSMCWGETKIPNDAVVVKLGGGPGATLGPAPPPNFDEKVSDADMAKLRTREPFKSRPDDAARQEKMKKLREAIDCAIKWVRRYDPQTADCLRRLYNLEKICIAFTSAGVGGFAKHDSKPGCSSDESINIYFSSKFSPPCEKVKIYDPDMFSLVNTLLHEGLHLGQNWTPPTVPGDTPNMKTVREIKVQQKAEFDASSAEHARLCELERVLKLVVQGTKVPAVSDLFPRNIHPDEHFAVDIAREIENDSKLTPMGKRMAASDLLAKVKALKGSAAVLRRCRAYLCVISELFLTGHLSVAGFQEKKKVLWWKKNFRTGAGFQIFYSAGGEEVIEEGKTTVFVPNTQFEQSGPARSENFELVGLDAVYAAELLGDDGEMLLVAGADDSVEDGVVLGYLDTDGDGFFEPATRIEVIRSNDLYGGIFFTPDPATGQTLAFNLTSNQIFGLTFSGAAEHKFPDDFDPRGNLDFSRDDILSILISEDGLTVSGMPDFDPETPTSILPSDGIPMAAAPAAGGEFVPGGVFDPVLESDFAPSIQRIPIAGDQVLLAKGRAGSTVIVMEASEDGAAIGFVVLDPQGCGTALLSRALVAGESVFVFDESRNLSSVTQMVFAIPDLRVAGAQRFSDNSFEIQFSGPPERQLTIFQGEDLSTWSGIGNLDLDAYGQGRFSTSPNILPRLFFRGELVPLPP